MAVRIYLSLKPVLERKGITQKQLAQMTGLREATISEMARNMRSDINKEHLALIMNALKVYDITEFIKVVVNDKIE
jgi:transcriptional regulator with XRE-family HTH domain